MANMAGTSVCLFILLIALSLGGGEPWLKMTHAFWGKGIVSAKFTVSG
jgi:hypothetical protein